MNLICANSECPEFDVVKLGGEGIEEITVICGMCGEPCETTDKEWSDPNADPAN